MEGSKSEAVFDSMNLNPQIFINETINSVEDYVDAAFDFYGRFVSHSLFLHEFFDTKPFLTKVFFLVLACICSEASKFLKINGSVKQKSQDLSNVSFGDFIWFFFFLVIVTFSVSRIFRVLNVFVVWYNRLLTSVWNCGKAIVFDSVLQFLMDLCCQRVWVYVLFIVSVSSLTLITVICWIVSVHQDESSVVHQDELCDLELDAELDSLRDKLNLVRKKLDTFWSLVCYIFVSLRWDTFVSGRKEVCWARFRAPGFRKSLGFEGTVCETR